MRRRASTAAIAAALFLAGASGGTQATEPGLLLADAKPEAPGSFYGGVGGAFVKQGIPEWRLYDQADGERLFEIKPDITLIGPTGRAGYVFKNTPSWLGRSARIEASGSYLRGRDSETQTNANPFPRLRTLDGVFPIAFIGVAGESVIDLETRHRSYGGGLRFLTDFKIDDRFFARPSVAISAGHTLQIYEARASFPNVPGFQNGLIAQNRIDESLSSDHFTGVLGLALTFEPTDRLALHGGVNGGLRYVSTDFKGAECINNVFSLNCSPFIVLGQSIGDTRVREAEDAIGYQAGVSGGITYSFGPASVSLLGMASYDSVAPKIVNPSFNHPRAAYVTHEGVASYGTMLTLTVPVN